MASAKVYNLRVRPFQSVDLCFEVAGILGEQSATAQLGQKVTGFDLAGFYGGLGVENNAADPGRLKFDSATIHTSIQNALLFATRAEPVKAALDKAIAARENAFYQKYKNQAAIIAKMQTIFDVTSASGASKFDYLNALIKTSSDQHMALNDAYVADTRTGVVKMTENDLTSTTDSNESSDGTNASQIDGTSKNHTDQTSTNNSKTTGTSGPASISTNTTGGGGASSDGTGSSTQKSNGTSSATSTGKSSQTQSTKNTDYVYRHPSLENDAQFQRAQASLIDETFNQFMFGQNLPVLDRVFTNELKAIDLDVKRFQVAYLNTILVSPIDGVITGLFKNLGDCVKAGEPVLRVESNDQVLLVGTIIFRGLLSIGSQVTVTTTLFGTSASVAINGQVVAVRGHKSDEDQWDVLVKCVNLSGGNPIFPINYNFDYDDTTVDIA